MGVYKSVLNPYTQSLAYAKGHGEEESYRTSAKLNTQCAEEIGNELFSNSDFLTYGRNVYCDKAFAALAEKYSPERIELVLSSYISFHGDERFDKENTEHADHLVNSMPISMCSQLESLNIKMHNTILNIFANIVFPFCDHLREFVSLAQNDAFNSWKVREAHENGSYDFEQAVRESLEETIQRYINDPLEYSKEMLDTAHFLENREAAFSSVLEKLVITVDEMRTESERAKQLAHDNGMAFYDGFYDSESEPNPYTYDGNMSFEDIALMNRQMAAEERLSMTINRDFGSGEQEITLTPDEMRKAFYIVKEAFVIEDIQNTLDNIAEAEPKLAGLSDDMDFVNDVLARFNDHSETHISYDDNIRNAIDHELEKRENCSEQSDDENEDDEDMEM